MPSAKTETVPLPVGSIENSNESKYDKYKFKSSVQTYPFVGGRVQQKGITIKVMDKKAQEEQENKKKKEEEKKKEDEEKRKKEQEERREVEK